MDAINYPKQIQLLSVKEVAEITRAGVSTVRAWIREGKLKSVKVGHFRRVRVADLERFIQGGGRDRGADLGPEDREADLEHTENDLEYWEKRFPPLTEDDPYFELVGIGSSKQFLEAKSTTKEGLEVSTDLREGQEVVHHMDKVALINAMKKEIFPEGDLQAARKILNSLEVSLSQSVIEERLNEGARLEGLRVLDPEEMERRGEHIPMASKKTD
jgi:excisionase family DNA binding protein